MMKISSVIEFDIENFIPYGYVNEEINVAIKDRIRRLVEYIIDIYIIIDKSKLSDGYRIRIESIDREVVGFIENFIKDPNVDQTTLASIKKNLSENFFSFYQDNLGYNAINNNSSLLFLGTFIKSFIVNPELLYQYKSINIENYINLFDNKFEELNKNINISKEILNELQKKTSEFPVSDYAKVFKDEFSNNKTIANRWLIVGIIISVVFVISIILFASFGWFEIVIRDDAGKLLYYNFSNLFTKVVLVAIQVFFISFCFKQYNVNKHLATLNKHRQNALNSYKLFQASIVGNDNGSHNALMIQVAKSIYEHPQSTGFLNENGQQMQSGIVELTKIIGDNKPN